MDDIEGVFFPVKTEGLDWKAVREKFNANTQYAYLDQAQAKEEGYQRNEQEWQFADGTARILQDERLFKMVLEAIQQFTPNHFKPV